MNFFNNVNKTNKSEIPQYSIHNGSEIFEELKKRLTGSQRSIKVAAAWFTDNDLFQVLLNKLDEDRGIKLEIVLDDNKENYWLPFMELIKKGALVKLSKGIGSNGRMHEKFCIIDDTILICGSYNWSKNARTENYENVIVSTIQKTVEEFIEKFEELLKSATVYISENLSDEISKEDAIEEIHEQELFTREFEKVLDEMIYSSVVAYDRGSLVSNGFERSEKCSGDANIIVSELNTVYTDMLNSISVSEQKKENLKARINTHLAENKSKLIEKLEREKEELLLNEEAVARDLNNQIQYVKEANNKLRDEINKAESAEIISKNEKIENLKNEKRAIEEDTLKMPFRWHVDIPTYIGLIGVFLYTLLFYSSAAYILMFAEQEAEQAKRLGLPSGEMGIYYSQAIPKAAAMGWTAVLLILFVPFFLICGIIFLKKVKTRSKLIIKISCLLLVDGFTALAVTKSVHDANYIGGRELSTFKFSQAYTEINLYLVFVFGMLSLLVFDLIISYILNNIESRSDFHLKRKKQIQIARITADISELNKENLELTADVLNKKNAIEINSDKISGLQKEIEMQPVYTKRKLNLAENETNNQLSNLENIVKIAYNKIENELFSFSTHYMNDRINIFLQGWNNYIYSYYAKSLAEEKIKQAKNNSDAWLREHFNRTEKFKNHQYENN